MLDATPTEPGSPKLDEEKKIGAKIRSLRIAAGMQDQQQLAAKLKMSAEAVKKIESGAATTMFARLAALARVLGATPNIILDFPDTSPREVEDRSVFRAVLEGAFLALGLPAEESAPLAEAAIEVLDSPVLHTPGTSRLDTARTVAQYVVSQALRAARR